METAGLSAGAGATPAGPVCEMHRPRLARRAACLAARRVGATACRQLAAEAELISLAFCAGPGRPARRRALAGASEVAVTCASEAPAR